jgi:hypothetical protein
MANYAVTDWTYGPAPLATVLAAMETYLETVDDTKTIRLMNVFHHGGDKYTAAIIHTA